MEIQLIPTGVYIFASFNRQQQCYLFSHSFTVQEVAQGSHVALCHIGTTQHTSCSEQFVMVTFSLQTAVGKFIKWTSSSMGCREGIHLFWKRNEDLLPPWK